MSIISASFLSFIVEHRLIESHDLISKQSHQAEHRQCVHSRLETVALEVSRHSIKHTTNIIIISEIV